MSGERKVYAVYVTQWDPFGMPRGETVERRVYTERAAAERCVWALICDRMRFVLTDIPRYLWPLGDSYFLHRKVDPHAAEKLVHLLLPDTGRVSKDQNYYLARRALNHLRGIPKEAALAMSENDLVWLAESLHQHIARVDEFDLDETP